MFCLALLRFHTPNRVDIHLVCELNCYNLNMLPVQRHIGQTRIETRNNSRTKFNALSLMLDARSCAEPIQTISWNGSDTAEFRPLAIAHISFMMGIPLISAEQTSLGAERLNWLKNDIPPKEVTTSSFLLLLSSVGSGLQLRHRVKSRRAIDEAIQPFWTL